MLIKGKSPQRSPKSKCGLEKSDTNPLFSEDPDGGDGAGSACTDCLKAPCVEPSPSWSAFLGHPEGKSNLEIVQFWRKAQ